SGLLRDALAAHLARLAAETDELALDATDDWGPSENWTDWTDRADWAIGGIVRRGEIWFAATLGGGDRPVLVLTRNPVADRIDRVVVAALTRSHRGVVSELKLTVA
ncbi:MAG: hypothetical protein ACRDRP_25140, partial [Pseudonocardiaceae bacterium]